MRVAAGNEMSASVAPCSALRAYHVQQYTTVVCANDVYTCSAIASLRVYPLDDVTTQIPCTRYVV